MVGTVAERPFVRRRRPGTALLREVRNTIFSVLCVQHVPLKLYKPTQPTSHEKTLLYKCMYENFNLLFMDCVLMMIL